ncbi:MAG: DUF4446 family protein [Candidatus Eremiobacteraeota bacterium]|nr:DUF4446 family protein [Candidatus Eremiobacteraeota bacterium]MBV8282626.1 DUF4446 family protein [Candidatus Eremiobacteraeota bacterium]
MSDAWSSLTGGMGAAAIVFVIIISAACSIVVVAIYHWAVARPRLQSAGDSEKTGPAIDTRSLEDLRNRTAALEAATVGALQHVGFVRFNAFADVGSELSYALAAVDGRGNGFLISSIYSREEVRSYAKAIREFATDKDLSAEERQALDIAVSQAKRRRV